MRAQIFKYWDRLNSSFWFLPTLRAFALVGLSFATVAIDRPRYATICSRVGGGQHG